MKKSIPHFLWLVGIVLLIVAAGKGSGAALPYQDSTPELLAIQRGQLHTAKLIAIVGAALIFTGVLWIFYRRFFLSKTVNAKKPDLTQS